MIQRQFDFPGTDEDLLNVLYQHYDDHLELSRIGRMVATGGNVWLLGYGPQPDRRGLMQTIKAIQYPATCTPLDPDEAAEKKERGRLRPKGKPIPCADLGIVLELGIVVNRTLPVTLRANPLFAREVQEILTVLRVIGPDDDLTNANGEAHTCHPPAQERPPTDGAAAEEQDPRQAVLQRLHGKRFWSAEDWQSYFDAWYVWTRGARPNLQNVADHCGKSLSNVQKRHAIYNNRHFPPF